MTAVLMTLGVVGVVVLQLMIRAHLPGVPWSAQGKFWSRIVLLMLGAGSAGLINFWGELILADAIRKATTLILLLLMLTCVAHIVLILCCPMVCGFTRRFEPCLVPGKLLEPMGWERSDTKEKRSEHMMTWLFILMLLLLLTIWALPEEWPARLSFARTLMLLSVLGFVLPPLIIPWPGLFGFDPVRTSDVTAACLLIGNIFLIGTMIAWPESVSARACFDPQSLMALCSVLAVVLVLGYVDVRRRFAAPYQDRKNGVWAFRLSLFVLAGCAFVLLVDMEHQHRYCGPFRGSHPSIAQQSAAEKGRPPVQVVRADPAQAGAIRAAAVGEAGSSKNGPAAKGGTRTPSAPEPASPPPMSTVDTLRAGLSVIDSRLTIGFLEEPSRGVYRLGLNWWHADLGDSSHAIGRGAEALREAGALVAGSGLRFASVEMRLMGMVQDRYGVRRARPLMRWLLDDKTMAPIQWAVIDGSDLLDLASVELEAEGLVPLMGYCDEDGHARESPVFCRLAGLRRGDREARLRRQLDELCEAVGTDLDGKYDGLETIEDLCRDI